MLRGYRVYAQKVKGDNGETLFNHTASVYLLDAQGRFVGTLAYQEPEDTALAKLRRLLAA
jgi:protein SCO1/2